MQTPEPKKPDFFDWLRGQLQAQLDVGKAVNVVSRVRLEVDAAERRWHATQVRTRNALLFAGLAGGVAAQIVLGWLLGERALVLGGALVGILAAVAVWVYVATRD